MFECRRQYDERSILDNIAIAVVLLERHCGEIGYGPAKSLGEFAIQATDAIRRNESQPANKKKP